MELTSLKFVVDTSDLKNAATEIERLGTAVNKLNKPLQEASTASKKLNKEQESVVESSSKVESATRKNVSVLERQQMILEFMTQGFSKGQSSQLAYAKAAGALTGEIEQLGKVLQTQRTLMGTDPFDKSLGALQALKNEYTVIKEVQRLYNAELGLSKSQMEDLAREKLRLIEKFKIEGATLKDIKAGLKELNAAYIQNATAENDIVKSIKTRQKAIQDAGKAQEYVNKEFERVNRLTSENGDITSATNNKLIAMENALKRTGMSAEEQARKLSIYREQLLSVQKAAGNRQVDYLSRALGPQITDIAVGLATGQSPMMVLLQQGGQLRDQFALAGVAGKEMGNMLVTATKSMVVSIKDTGAAIGSALISGLASAGNSATNFIGKITGVNALVDVYKQKLAAGGEENFKFIGTLQRIGTGFSILAGVGIAGAIAGLIAFGVALREVMQQESEANRTAALYGGRLGLTQNKILELSAAYAGSRENIGTFIAAINEAARSGDISSASLEKVTKAAVTLEKVGGQSVKETIKQFSDLGEKPTETLIKLTKQTGLVNVEILKNVQALELQGKKSQAAALAQEEYAKALEGVATTIRKDMGWVESFFDTIASAAKRMWNAILNVGRKGTLDEQLNKAVDKMKELQSAGGLNTGRRDRMVEAQAKVITGILEQIEAENELGKVKKKNSDEASALGRKAQIKSSEEVPKDNLLANLEAQQKNMMKELDSSASLLTRENATYYSLGLKDLSTYLSDEISLIRTNTENKIAVNEWYLGELDKAQKQQIDVVNKTFSAAKNGKTFEEIVELERKRKVAIENTTEAYNRIREGVLSANEVLSNKSAEQQTKAFEALGAELRTVREGTREFVRSQDDLIERRRIQLEQQNSLLMLSGADLERVKAQIQAEQSHVAKLSELQAAADRAALALSRLTLSGLSPDDPKYQNAVDAVKKAQENLEIARGKSREAIVKAGIDAEMSYYQQRYAELRKGITDSIVTALFEGGKSGSKKLRDVIVAELKRPITVMVNALVDVTMNKLIGGGSKGGSFAESIVGSFLQKQVGSIMVGGSTLAATGSAFLTGLQAGMTGTSTAAAQAAYTAAGQQGVSSGLAYGQAAAPFAGAAGGMLANKVISQDYEISKTMTTLQNVATVAAAFIPGLGPLVALGVGAISGLANRAFGMKAKQITGEGIIGVLTTQGADVKAFTDWFQKGGWFRSNKSGRNYSAVSQSLQEYLDLSLKGLSASTRAYANVLGIDAKEIDTVQKSIELQLKGLSAEERQKKIDEALGGFGDELAKKIGFESFDALQKLGEQVLKERYDLETQLLTLQGNTTELRRREREQIYETNRALFDQVKAMEDQKEASEKLAAASRSVVDEINRLRGVSTSKSGLESQFAILTAQARAGDMEALAKLPEITKGLEQMAAGSAVSAADVVLARARLAQSLQDTLGYTGGMPASPTATIASVSSLASISSGTSNVSVSANSSNQELLNALVTEIQGLRAEVRSDVSHNAKTAKILERANQDGETLSVSATIDGGVV